MSLKILNILSAALSAGENYVIRARIRRPGTAEVAAEFTLLAHAQTLPTGK